MGIGSYGDELRIDPQPSDRRGQGDDVVGGTEGTQIDGVRGGGNRFARCPVQGSTQHSSGVIVSESVGGIGQHGIS